MNTLTLTDYGWSPFFQSQLDIEDLQTSLLTRVMAVHRGFLDVAGPDFEGRIETPHEAQSEDERATVGDWLTVDRETQKLKTVLERKSTFKRKAPGTSGEVQLIAANVDTVFIVSSCNQDFNIARLERYLVLAREAEVMPVVVLTKADLTADAEDFISRVATLDPGLLAEALDGRDAKQVEVLRPWCGPGQTVAVLGSSGVGKSTLLNTLSGHAAQTTQGIREDDAKGRHTTTSRSLHLLPAGGWLLDTPGMREIQLTDTQDGLSDVFSDILDLSHHCRFNDCSHVSEPECAIQEAIQAGSLDPDRFARYRKLQAEDARNTQSVAERRANDRSFGKMIKSIQNIQKKRGKA